MSKKYYITESQMKRIVSHVKSGSNEQEVIEEGWKEVALGAALLLGATFGGNKAMAQQANDAINQTEILQNIKTTLEDDEGIAKLADYISTRKNVITPEQLKTYMSNNADKVESDFELAAKKKKINLSLDIKDVRGQKHGIKSKITHQGYAVSDIKITSDTILQPQDVVYVQDTIDIAYSNDDMFVTAKYELKPAVMNDINQTIENIQAMGGKVVGVNIEASTDKEPIKMGNQQLAQNRANSVKSVLGSFGITSDISVNLLPDQGPDVYSRTMNSQQRKEARKKTAEYRYVKVSFVVVVAEKVVTPEPLYRVVKKVQVELVRTNTYKAGGITLKYKGSKTKTKKNKCKKVKRKGKSIPCEMFD